EERYPGDAARPGGRRYPGGDSYPGGPDHPGAAVPERPAPAGRGRRAAAADLAGETVAYRAPNGSASGRHSHRADPDQPAGGGPPPQAGEGHAGPPGPPPSRATTLLARGTTLLARAMTPLAATMTPGRATRSRRGGAGTPRRAAAASAPCASGGTTARPTARVAVPGGARDPAGRPAPPAVPATLPVAQTA